MAASNAKTNSKKTMDVAAPGKQAPDVSARPVIIGHKPMVKDPMVKPEDGELAVTTEEVGAEPIVHTTKTIEPLTPTEEDIPPVEAAEEAPAAATEQPVSEASAEDVKETPDEPAESAVESNESAEVDALAEQVDTSKKRY